jgi:hypothetical protein
MPPRSAIPWLATALVVGSAVLVALAFLTQHDGTTPPAILFAASGVVIAIVGGVCVSGAARAAGSTVRVAIALAGGFASIAVAKFAFGPLGLYEANQERPIQSLFTTSPVVVLLFTAVGVFAIYVVALWLIATTIRRRAEGSVSGVSTFGAIVGIVFGAAWILAIGVVLGGAASYLSFIAASSAAVGVALALGLAMVLITTAFAATGIEFKTPGEISTYVSLFALALAFLVVFQVLWIVFMLVLASIWPLRTVTPK